MKKLTERLSLHLSPFGYFVERTENPDDREGSCEIWVRSESAAGLNQDGIARISQAVKDLCPFVLSCTVNISHEAKPRVGAFYVAGECEVSTLTRTIVYPAKRAKPAEPTRGKRVDFIAVDDPIPHLDVPKESFANKFQQFVNRTGDDHE